MHRFYLALCFATALLTTTHATGQHLGGFLLANPDPSKALNMETALLPNPQSSDVEVKNPWIAFGLSALITGGGQYYNGQYGKGTIQFVAASVGFGVFYAALEDDYKLFGETIDPDEDNDAGAIGALVFLGSAIWSMIDAPVSANRINQQARQASLQFNPMIKDDLTGVSLTLRF